jgi:hypothetical protein
MKVKCIDNSDGLCNLTVGKIYEVIEEEDIYCYYIINNIGNNDSRFAKCRFEPLSKSEARNDKINKLLEL